MAKRTRKQKQRPVARRPGPSVAPPTSSAPTGVAVEAADLQPLPAAGMSAAATVPAEPGRRRVERLSGTTPVPAKARPGRSQASSYIQPLDSDDAAIPFDRVPYVPSDLRRVAIIATIMIALIIVADIIVSNVVK